MKNLISLIVLLLFYTMASGQKLAPKPPMGWMTWNYFGVDINEEKIKEMADALVASGMAEAGYEYIYIDDGWQGGRDNRNKIIPDAKKFPSGIKALADYVHGKGLKLGIYSDAAQLTCAGYTASFGFEQQDAQTFAHWGIDYLKYDYCGAPKDSTTAKIRYGTMADALRKTNRNIVFSICEWGQRQPWKWAGNVGGQLWRVTGDVRDKWKDMNPNRNPPFTGSYGIIDIIDDNATLSKYAGPGRWNDMDMLVVGLHGNKGPSAAFNAKGCTVDEYQTQMSMWCMMASPLAASNDIRNMDAATKRILLNKEIIALNQDKLGRQAEVKISNDHWYVFLKPLSNGDYAVSILNLGPTKQRYKLKFQELGLKGSYTIRDLWEHKTLRKANQWQGKIGPHETKVFRLNKA